MISKNNLFQISDLPSSSEIENFSEIYKSKKLTIERIISNGWNKETDKWYDQKENEWVILLKGYATIVFEDKQCIEMNEGDYIFIPSQYKHKISKTSSIPPCVWLAIHF